MSSNDAESTSSGGAGNASYKGKRRREDEQFPPDLTSSTSSSSVTILRPAPFFYYIDRWQDPDDDPSVPIVPLGRHVNLPGKLHFLLNRPDLSSTISWMPHGRSWKIHNTSEFQANIMPQFWGKCSWSSFLRQVRFWGFIRKKKGRDKGSYYHECFLRGLPHLCKRMERIDKRSLETSDTNVKNSSKEMRQYEPDLYAINEIHPLESVPTNSYHMEMLESTMEAGPNARMALNHEIAVNNVGVGESDIEVLDFVDELHISYDDDDDDDAILGGDSPLVHSGVQVEPSLQQQHPSQEEQQPKLAHDPTPAAPQSSTTLQELQQIQTQVQSEEQVTYDNEMNDLVRRQMQLFRWQAFLLPFLQLGTASVNTLQWLTRWWVQYGTVPTFTEEDELRERQSTSPQEQLDARAHVIGCATASASSGDSTDEFSAEAFAALSLLRKEINEYYPNEKAELMEAANKCPDLVDDTWSLLFLQSENFDAKAAAKRMVTYWKLRVATLGSDLAFLPVTINNIFPDDLQLYHLKLGHMRIMPVTDLHGRSILYLEPGRIHGKEYDTDIMKRSTLYMCHASLDQPDIVKYGVVIIVNLKTANQGHVNVDLIIHLIKTLNCFPFCVKAMHFCQISKPIQKLFFPIGKFFMRSFLRRRIEVHTEVGKKLLEKYRLFGIPPERLPSELGGMIELNHEKWIQNRKENGSK